MTSSTRAKPAQRPWAELSAVLPGFQRAAGHGDPGRRGVGRPHLGAGSRRSAAEAASTAIEPDQLRVMAQLEHESWLRFYLEHGWTYGETRNDAQRVHNALVPLGPA